MPDTGSRLERYELLDRIAIGGMAEVFRAKASGAHGFEKTLAIKRILPDLARDPEFEQRFINEAKLAVKLSHANVVQVFDFGRFAGSLFIAMEYVEGLDLAALLRVQRNRDELLPLPSALYIAIEMARGLDFAHQRRVIHRDVSPSNILLSRAGEVKIADFGIAEAVAKRHRQNKSGARRIMGKWRYMSPEQTRAESLTIASDVFAAAAVMYEVFTNTKLFPGDEAEDIINNIHKMTIPPASEINPGLPTRVDDVLARALERKPDARPSAAEILRELLDISYDSTIVASALGVSDAVASVLGKGGGDDSSDRVNLDDLIRAQLMESEGRAPTVRKTAVEDVDPRARGAELTGTAQAVVTRAVDSDGITILEVDETLPAGPVAMRGGKRDTQEPPIAGLDDEPAADGEGDDAGEPDEEDSDVLASDSSSSLPEGASIITDTGEPPRRLWAWFAAIAAAALFAGGGAWLARGGSEEQPAKLPVKDVSDAGQVAVAPANLIIESEPSGAEVLIDGVLQTDRTPLTIAVEPGVPHQIELRADGYAPHQRGSLTLRPGQDLLISPRLERLRATLEITTRPTGAVVYLGDERLGETPLSRASLRPGAGLALRIEKPDYKTIEMSIDLIVGRPLVIKKTMVSSIRYGMVKIGIIPSEAGGWAYVEHNGKRLGLAKKAFRLPVGRQRIKLTNPETGASRWVAIRVTEGETKTVRFSLAE